MPLLGSVFLWHAGVDHLFPANSTQRDLPLDTPGSYNGQGHLTAELNGVHSHSFLQEETGSMVRPTWSLLPHLSISRAALESTWVTVCKMSNKAKDDPWNFNMTLWRRGVRTWGKASAFLINEFLFVYLSLLKQKKEPLPSSSNTNTVARCGATGLCA